MKNTAFPIPGKILVHYRGTGLFTREDMEIRAQEIALINGRSIATTEDRRQAKHELRGDNLPPIGDTGADSSRALTRDPSEPLSNFGSEKARQDADDGQNMVERLVIEGVEEAQHDQMVAACRRHER